MTTGTLPLMMAGGGRVMPVGTAVGVGFGAGLVKVHGQSVMVRVCFAVAVLLNVS